jgi:hypothetical protein
MVSSRLSHASGPEVTELAMATVAGMVALAAVAVVAEKVSTGPVGRAPRPPLRVPVLRDHVDLRRSTTARIPVAAGVGG